MIIMGFDLSMSDTGWAVLDVTPAGAFTVVQSGHIKSKSVEKGTKRSTGARLAGTMLHLQRIIDTYQPDHIAKESSFSNNNNRSTQQIYKLNGVFELLLYQSSILSFDEYAPTTIKKQITGNGRATKAQVAEAVKALTGVVQGNDNVTDAIAVAITHSVKQGLITLPE